MGKLFRQRTGGAFTYVFPKLRWVSVGQNRVPENKAGFRLAREARLDRAKCENYCKRKQREGKKSRYRTEVPLIRRKVDKEMVHLRRIEAADQRRRRHGERRA